MAQTYYAQRDNPEPTMTVSQLVTMLSKFDPELPVVFQSPLYGAFGSNTMYAIEHAENVLLERKEKWYPGGTRMDEETGEPEEYEPWTDVFHAWRGIVIR